MKIYRNFNKGEKFQSPVIFVDSAAMITDGSNYLTETLITSDIYQSIPDIATIPFKTLVHFRDTLLDALHNITGDSMESTLTRFVYYNKLIDIFPTKKYIEIIQTLITELSDISDVPSTAIISTAVATEELSKIETKYLYCSIVHDYSRLDMDSYVLDNRVGFTNYVQTLSERSRADKLIISKFDHTDEPSTYRVNDIQLSTQQKFVADYLNDNTPYKGLLLYHGLGSGKSGASIAITNGYKRRVIVLLPASLKNNYLEEISKFGDNYFNSNFNWKKITIPARSVNLTLYNVEILRIHDMGIPYEMFLEISELHADGSRTMWFINNDISVGQVVRHKMVSYRVDYIEGSNIYGTKLEQHGGGKCGLCKSPGTTKASCPLNPKAKHPNPARHPLASKLDEGVAPIAPATSAPAPTILLPPVGADALRELTKMNIKDVSLYTYTQSYSDDEKKHICDQIHRVLNYKYIITPYNASKYTIINLFRTADPENFKKLFSDQPSKITQEQQNTVINRIFNEEDDLKNPFDDKILVIDEVHNLISLMMPSDTIKFYGGCLCELIMRAENLKIVALSGTPGINSIYEFSILYNLLRGVIKVYTYTLTIPDGSDKRVRDALDKLPFVDRYTLQDGTLEFTRIPRGFGKVFDSASGEYLHVKKNRKNERTDTAFRKNFTTNISQLTTVDGTFSGCKIHTLFSSVLNTLLPTNKRMIINTTTEIVHQRSQFEERYIDADAQRIKYSRNFKNNIIGLTSFYNERTNDIDESGGTIKIFPDVTPTECDLILSPYQFTQYCLERRTERIRERQSQISKFAGKASQVASFKTRTRQVSIFSFPPDIQRPTPVNYTERKMLRIITDVLTKIQKDPVGTLNNDETEVMEHIQRLLDIKTNFLARIGKYSEEEMSTSSVSDIIDATSATYMDTAHVDRDSKYINRLGEFLNIHANTLPGVSTADDVAAVIEYGNGIFLTGSSDDGDDLLQSLSESRGEYSQALDHAINTIYDQGDKFLSIVNVLKDGAYNLSVLSPKYYEIFTNIIHSPGSIFVYSNYLNAEGIMLFTKVLEYNGFTKLTWESTDVENDIDSEWCGLTNSTKKTGHFTTREIEKDKLVRWTRLVDEKMIATTHRVLDISDDDKCTLSGGDADIRPSDKLTMTYSDSEDDIGPIVNKSELSLCYFSLWTGSQGPLARAGTLKRFNSKENTYGQICQIILATQAGAEGISLKNVRQVHIMEPYWNNVKMDQVTGRARRVNSHTDLHPDDQNVEVFKYRTVFSDSQINLEIPIDTNIYNDGIYSTDEISAFKREIVTEDNKISTDMAISNIAKRKEILLKDFLFAIKESSVDCSLNLLDNRTSDAALGDMECHKPSTEDGISEWGGYMYSINPMMTTKFSSDRDAEFESDAVRAISTKYIILDFKPAGWTKTIKCMVFANSKSELDGKIGLYDLYSFYGINPLQKEERVRIGRMESRQLIFTDEFHSNIGVLKVIQQCWDDVLVQRPEYSGAERDEGVFDQFKFEVLKRYDETLLEYQFPQEDGATPAPAVNKWICAICTEERSLDDSACTVCGWPRS